MNEIDVSIKEDERVYDFLERVINEKRELGKDVVGKLGGFSFTTENCVTAEQLQNKISSYLKSNIAENKEVVSTSTPKRFRDDFVLLFNRDVDESVEIEDSMQADWNDPADVLNWIECSEAALNNPEFARLTYKDGKTASELVVDILKAHGYGQVSENQNEIMKEINGKMSDLENYGFLVNDFFQNVDSTTDLQSSTSKVEEQIVESAENINSETASIFQTRVDNNQSKVVENQESATPLTSIFQTKENMGELDREPVESSQGQPSFANTIFSERPVAEETVEESPVVEEEQTEANNFESVQETIDEVRAQLSTPSEDMLENEAAIQLAITTRNEQDIKRAEEALNAMPENEKTAKFREQLNTIKETMKNQSAPSNAQSSELAKFQEKYGPTANPREMKTVKKMEEKLSSMAVRKSEILTEIKELQEQIEELNSTKKQVGQMTITDIENRKNTDRLVKEVQNMARQATALPISIRENEAMPYFNKAAETHSREDIMQALFETEKLGNTHVFYSNLTNALDSMAMTYFGKSAQEIRNEIIDCSKAINEVHQVAELNPSQNQPESKGNIALEAFNKASIERTRENLEAALKQVEELGEDHAFAASMTSAIDKLLNTYCNTSVENVRNEENLKKEAEKAIVNVKNMARQATALPIAIRENEAMPYFNKAAETHSKEDIIQAIFETEKLTPSHVFYNYLTDALNKLSMAHYGVQASELREQVMNLSSQMNQANELINDKALEKTEEEKEAASLYQKAIETLEENDINNALEHLNSLNDESPLKKPLLDALNSKIAFSNVNLEVTNGNNKRIKDLESRIENLQTELNEINEKEEKYNSCLEQYAENKKKEREELEQSKEKEEKNPEEHQEDKEVQTQEEKEPPEEIVEETTEKKKPLGKIVSDIKNNNPHLFQKAVYNASNIIAKIWNNDFGKIAMAGVLTVGLLANPLIAIPTYLIANLISEKVKYDIESGKIDFTKKEKRGKESKTTTQEPVTEVVGKVNSKEPTKEESEIKEENIQTVSYYKLNDEGSWQNLPSRGEVIDSVANEDRIGYSMSGSKQPENIQDVDNLKLEQYLTTHDAQLPTAVDVEEIKRNQVLEQGTDMTEGMGRGK